MHFNLVISCVIPSRVFGDPVNVHISGFTTLVYSLNSRRLRCSVSVSSLCARGMYAIGLVLCFKKQWM